MDTPGGGGCHLHQFLTPLTSIITARAQLKTALRCTNYEVKFRLLLHLEELQMEHDIRHYDLESVPMTWEPVDRSSELLTLEVASLMGHWEGGPSSGRQG